MMTGIGALVAGIGALIANWDTLKASLSTVSEEQQAVTESLDDYKQGATDAITKVNQVGASFELAKKGVISKEEALLTYNETLGDSFGKMTDVNEAEAVFIAKQEQLNAERLANEKTVAEEVRLLALELVLEKVKGSENEYSAWKALQDEKIAQLQRKQVAELASEKLTAAEKVKIEKATALQIEQLLLPLHRANRIVCRLPPLLLFQVAPC